MLIQRRQRIFQDRGQVSQCCNDDIGVLGIQTHFNVRDEWIDHGEKRCILILVLLDQLVQQIQCPRDETMQIGLSFVFNRLRHSGMATLRLRWNQMVFAPFIEFGVHRLVSSRVLLTGVMFLGLCQQMMNENEQGLDGQMRIRNQTALESLQAFLTLGDLSGIATRRELLSQWFDADEKFIFRVYQTTEKLHDIGSLIRLGFGNVRRLVRRILMLVRFGRFSLLLIEQIRDEQIRDGLHSWIDVEIVVQ